MSFFPSLYGQEFELTGTLTEVDPSGTGTQYTDFVVKVSGTKSHISNKYFNGEVLLNGCDGTNSFFLNKMETVKGHPQRWEWGTVSAGRFPVKDLTAGQVCWIAFACFVPSAAEYPEVFPLASFQENAPFTTSLVTPMQSRPHLPQRIQWQGTNILIGASGKEKVMLPYKHGFLAGEYVVTSTTNWRGFELPLSFDLKTFRPHFSGKDLPHNQVELASVLRGKVMSIGSLQALEDFRPGLGSRAQIQHYKIPDGTYGSFRLTRLNGQWPDESDADFRQKAEVVRNLQGRPHSTSSPARKWVLTAMIACSFLSLAAIVVMRIKRSK